MRIGINGTGLVGKASIDAIRKDAEQAAEAGFSSYWLAEHPTGGFDALTVLAAIANDVRFGLGSGVWTSDIGRAIRMSERIQAGTVWVNTYRAVSYMSPFGGYKDSGLGR